MIFLSVDIETTGLDHNSCQILEIGAVLADTGTSPESWPTFRRLIRHDLYWGESYALSMHQKLFEELSKGRGVAAWEALLDLKQWLINIGVVSKITIAGKNFAAFDKNFLEKHEHWREIPKHHRYLDVGNLYFDPMFDDEIPSTERCLQLAGLESGVAQTALEDALVVAKLINLHIQQRVRYYDEKTN
jgi:oligoribonuclease (3'-5' exoribonuclease)